jgi:hypothetical protein
MLIYLINYHNDLLLLLIIKIILIELFRKTFWEFYSKIEDTCEELIRIEIGKTYSQRLFFAAKWKTFIIEICTFYNCFIYNKL